MTLEHGNWMLNNERPEGYRRPANSPPALLFALRDSKRTIVDSPEVIEFLGFVMKRINGQLRLIKFNEHSPLSQAAHVQDADILMGLHGADLTNMMYLRRGATLIELNPPFFFEPRFHLMSQRLDLQYLVWTCTFRGCAFSGHSGNFDIFLATVRDH